MSLSTDTLDHLAAWCRNQRPDEGHAFGLYCAMLDGIRADDSVLDGDPDWPLVAQRLELTVHGGR